MPVNCYIGKSQEWLEEKLAALQEEKASASRVIASSGADTYGQFQVTNIDKEIEQILTALNALDPDKYPSTQIRRVTRTAAKFWDV